MTTKSIPWPHYINNTISTTASPLTDNKKRQKQNRRSKSMFEWSLPNPTTTTIDTTCASPAVMAVLSESPRRSRMEQQNEYSAFMVSDEKLPYVYGPHEYINRCNSNVERENISTGDFPSSSMDDEKNGLSPISITTSTTTSSSMFQRSLKNPLQHHYNDDNNDEDDHSRNKLPIRTWSLKQHSINNSTMQCVQRFLTQFVKAFVSSGAPSHRLDTCTRLLLGKWNMAAQFGYFPGFMMISFENPYDTFPTRVQLVKMETDLDIHRLIGIHQVFESIIMDEMTIQQATDQLDRITQAPRLYSNWMTIFAYGVASSTSMPLFFYGGWMDMVFGLGLGMLVAIGSVYVSQRITRFASIFDVVQCTVVGFLAATASSRLPSTTTCFYALSVGGVVNLLPGYAALVAMLEIASGDAAVASGTLRLTTTLVYSLLLGFGLAIGASTHQLLFPRLALISSHASCENTLSSWSHVLLVPFFSIANAIILRAHYRSKFGIILVLAIISHGVHYVALLYFVNYPHLATVLAAFVVALGSNIYARLHPTVGFVDMIIGLFFLIPGSVGVSSTLDTFGHALSNAASSPSPSNTSAVAEMSIILNAGQQGILFAVHMMVITVSVAMGLVLAALVIYPVRKLLECDCIGSSSSSSSFSIFSSASSLSAYCNSPSLSKRKIKYRRRDWIGEVTF